MSRRDTSPDIEGRGDVRLAQISLRHMERVSGKEESVTISRILVPTDFSVHSDAAFEYAMELTRTVNANIRVLHVVHNLLEPGMWSGVWSDEIDTADLEKLQVNLVRHAEERLTHWFPGTRTSLDGSS